MQLSMLKQLLGDALSGTEPSQADIVFEDSYSFELGGMTFEIFHPGTAHTPGDSFVWLEAKDTVFAVAGRTAAVKCEKLDCGL